MPKPGYLFLLIAVALGAAACSKTQDPNQAALNSAGNPAADGNLAPVSDTGQYQNQAPPPNYQNSPPPAGYADNGNYQQPAPPPYYQGNNQNYAPANYDDSYSDQPDYSGQQVYASQPPPPLPEYSQPPCPGDNYMWTPGYWSYGDAGYYWVPGAWVLAPYVDALWTPPYWDFYGDRYRWHRGYWGRHIGFYGGIDYGFGYTGRGYYGGYWNGGSFAYNRSVTNVNSNVVHNVYQRGVPSSRNTRVSYNGGPGGLNARPIPAEMAALRETRTAPVQAQIQHARAAQDNRAQFASVNRGRPPQIAAAQPLATNYRAPAARPVASEQLRPVPAREQARPAIAERPGAPAQRAQNQPAPFQREQPGRQQAQQQQQGRPEPNRPAPQARPEFARQAPAPAAPQQRPVAQQRQLQERPAPPQQQQRPVPEARPAPAPRPVQEARPQPAFRPVEQARPAPQPRPAPIQAARPAPAPRPAPEARPAPAARPEEKQKR